MLSTRGCVLVGVAAVSAMAVFTGCSTGGVDGNGAHKASEAAAQPSAGQSAAPSGNQAVGLSPEGVTTRIDEPAQSTEEQYAQSCLAAKDWITAKGGDPHSHVEPLLKDVQGSTESSPVTFRKTWSELSAPQQAAVIIAVNAAADGGC